MANDTMVGSAVSVAKRLGKSPARVYEAFLDPAVARAWMGLGSDGVSELAIDARPGGAFRFVAQRGGAAVEHRGEYRELVPGKRLVFTWVVPSQTLLASIVTIDLLGAGDVTQVVLSHDGVLPEYQSRTREGWGKILDEIGR